MMEDFLNYLPKFNNSLLDLLFLTFSIKTVSFREFYYIKIAQPLYFQALCNSIIFVSVIPTLHIKPATYYKTSICKVLICTYSIFSSFLYMLFEQNTSKVLHHHILICHFKVLLEFVKYTSSVRRPLYISSAKYDNNSF